MIADIILLIALICLSASYGYSVGRRVERKRQSLQRTTLHVEKIREPYE